MTHAPRAPSPYPESPRERDRWITSRRPPRRIVDARRPYAFLTEDEVDAHGEVGAVSTIFLTSRECPWRCLMCDLWRNTLARPLPAGAIVEQIEFALAALPPARTVKLYNSGSFFDHRAISPSEYGAIATRLGAFERVIVESHPQLVNDDVPRFRDHLAGDLEVAMGLETVHPDVLPRLNKRMTLDLFAGAAARLRRERVALRAFVLVKPPFLSEEEALDWAVRSTEYAFDQGAGVVSLIPVRAGNGALDALAESGAFAPPRLATLEEALERGLGLGRGRVFADLWDLHRFADCASCLPQRAARLHAMNLSQAILPAVACPSCGGGG